MFVRPEPADDNPLWDYFRNNRGRLIHKWHHYFDIYHSHFRRFRGQAVTVLEIGVSHGGSLQMWKWYFGESARIVGLDRDPRCKRVEEEQISVFIGDQSDGDFLRNLSATIGAIDIVIDDGGHTMRQQVTAFQALFPAVSERGIYLVEDLHTSYWSEFRSERPEEKTFIEHAKALIDALNARHSRDANCPLDCAQSVTGLHFYDSVLVVEKYPNPGNVVHSKTGNCSF